MFTGVNPQYQPSDHNSTSGNSMSDDSPAISEDSHIPCVPSTLSDDTSAATDDSTDDPPPCVLLNKPTASDTPHDM